MRTFLFLFFTLFILQTRADFNEVSLDDFQNDPSGQRALYFGSQWMSSQLVGYGIISSGSWNVSQTISVSEENDDGGTNYLINSVISDGSGDSFTALYVVNVNTNDDENSIEVGYASYQLDNGNNAMTLPESELEELFEEEPPVLEEADIGGSVSQAPASTGWTDVGTATAQSDSTIDSLLDQGANYAIFNAQSQGTLSSDNWNVFSVDAVASLTDSAGTTYRFTVTMSDGKFMRARSEYFVLQNPSGGSRVQAAGFWAVVPASA